MKTQKWLHIIAFIFVIIGAIDLGLYGLIPGKGFDILDAVFGFSPSLRDTVYILIGVSGIYLLIMHRKSCLVCK